MTTSGFIQVRLPEFQFLIPGIEVHEWLEGVVIDDSMVSDRVEMILHPDRDKETINNTTKEGEKAMDTGFLSYENFKKEFSKGLEMAMGSEYEVTSQTVNKVNVTQDALSVKRHDSNVAPTIYIGSAYEKYQDGHSLGETISEAADVIRNAQIIAAPEISREGAKKNLYCAVVNADDNRDLLKDVPHERIEDLAIIARYHVGENGSFIVSNNLCSNLQMTSEEIMDMAAANMAKEKFTCSSLQSVMQGMMSDEGMSDDFQAELFPMETPPIYVLTNAEKVDGAAAIVAKDVLAEAQKKIGEDFYILPSSRHEVLLVAERFCQSPEDVRGLENMVREVNSTQLSKEDKLSDHVYHYSTESKKLEMVNIQVLEKGRSDIPKMALADEPKHTRHH